MQAINGITDFLYRNALYLALGMVVIILIVIFIFLLAGKKKKSQQQNNQQASQLILAFGGSPNIVKVTVGGSRVSVYLEDLSLFDSERLKQAGFASFIQMSDRITILVGEQAPTIGALLSKKQ